MISGSDRFQNIVPERDHIDTQPSTSSNTRIVIVNTPQVPMSVEQPAVETPQVTNDHPVDQVVQEEPEMVEQPVDQHDP